MTVSITLLCSLSTTRYTTDGTTINGTLLLTTQNSDGTGFTKIQAASAELMKSNSQELKLSMTTTQTTNAVLNLFLTAKVLTFLEKLITSRAKLQF